ncbi:MAG TPA: apolipoprotein N-acyltransferase [Tepidisphaeraceae bacterium]|nr:apolipoprotein N-acyltransferase [Tepidisphaeraceae bacterium]
MAKPRRRLRFAQRWWGKLGLLLLTTALLTFAFAPFDQFFLAWVALVPWLIVLSACRSPVTAFLWSWLGGVAFFIANMWWLVYVTGPGMVALMAVLGLYWGAAGAVIVGWRLAADAPDRSGWAILGAATLIAVIWAALEWLRGFWPLGGLAWLYLGHTQSPFTQICQISDVTGVYGVSFVIALINAALALAILNRESLRALIPMGVTVLVVLGAILGYGSFRLHQHTTHPGPTVMVVQANYPQSNSGEKGADLREILAFHLSETRKALVAHPADLVVWSETMMPSINPQTRHLMSIAEEADVKITALAQKYHLDLLVGGSYYDHWVPRKDGYFPLDRRNSAYFYTANGQSSLRYDKIHLVPFGEYLPFKSGFPPLYRLFIALSPYDEEKTEASTLTPGSPDALTVFEMKPGWRFVTPICFEDIDADLVRRMFEPQGSSGKRADFIVNITNDGWFKYNEMPQHLQAAVFRSIENRVPTARSVNTGISGFIDSVGRTSDLVSADREGVSTRQLQLDDRVSVYTRIGDVFAYVCAGITGLLVVMGLGRWWRERRIRRRAAV